MEQFVTVIADTQIKITLIQASTMSSEITKTTCHGCMFICALTQAANFNSRQKLGLCIQFLSGCYRQNNFQVQLHSSNFLYLHVHLTRFLPLSTNLTIFSNCCTFLCLPPNPSLRHTIFVMMPIVKTTSTSNKKQIFKTTLQVDVSRMLIQFSVCRHMDKQISDFLQFKHFQEPIKSKTQTSEGIKLCFNLNITYPSYNSCICTYISVSTLIGTASF